MRSNRISPSGRILILAALLPLTACATKGDLRNVTTELRALSARQDSLLMALERQALVTQDSLRGTTSQLLEVRGTVNQQLARITQELGMLRQENAQFAQMLSGIRDALERVTRMSSAPQTAPSGSGTTGSPAGSNDAVDLFQAGYEMYSVRNYGTARKAFQEVVDRFSHETEIASEAQYKLGEIALAEQKPSEALEAFLVIRRLWPSAPRAADATVQVGKLHAEQQNWSDARRMFQTVINTWPNTQAAVQAEERLRALPPGQ